MKTQRIAVETLTLKELSDMFRKSLLTALPRSDIYIKKCVSKLNRANITNYTWVKTYEIFKGAKLNFYCQKVPSSKEPIVSVGMTHRTFKGMVLIEADLSNGGLTDYELLYTQKDSYWNEWIRIYTGHYCERYAERIMKAKEHTFKVGSEGVMWSELNGVVRVNKDILYAGVDEVIFQFKEGQAYGYRDTKNKVTLFRTVYSNDMLKGDNLKISEELQVSSIDFRELFK